MEYHFGVCTTSVLDFRIDADTDEEAQEKFREHAAAGTLFGLPKVELERNIEVLGMVEGPLPDNLPEVAKNLGGQVH